MKNCGRFYADAAQPHLYHLPLSPRQWYVAPLNINTPFSIKLSQSTVNISVWKNYVSS
jgi:hypothetical protein